MNPEFKKNYWLNISLHKLLITPVVTILIIYLIYLTSFGNIKNPGATFDGWLLFGLISILSIQGVFLCGQSLVSEYTQKTWDFLRVSPLSPWSIVWGKLLGSTLLSWYTALIIIITYLNSHNIFPSEIGQDIRVFTLLTAIVFSTGMQACAILAICVHANITGRTPSDTRNLAVSIAFFAALVAMIMFGNLMEIPRKGLDSSVNLYAFQINKVYYLLLTSTLFLIWATLGAYFQMRKQMLFENGKMPWIVFNIFLAIYVAGYMRVYEGEVEQSSPEEMFTRAYFTISLLIYMTSVTMANQNDLMQFVSGIRNQNWRKIWVNMPLCIPSVALLALLVLYLFIFPILTNEGRNIGVLGAGGLLFICRDLAIIAGLVMTHNSSKGVLTAVFYLFILYSIIPLTLIELGQENALLLFWPIYNNEVFLLYPLIEVILAILFLKHRLRRFLPQMA